MGRHRYIVRSTHGNLLRGDPIALADKDLEGKPHWLPSRVIALVSNGYIVVAPWTGDGKTFVAKKSEGKTWQRRDDERTVWR